MVRQFFTFLAFVAAYALSVQSSAAMSSLPPCFIDANDLTNVAFCNRFYGLPPASNDRNVFDHVRPEKREKPEEPGKGGEGGENTETQESARSEGGAMETFSPADD